MPVRTCTYADKSTLLFCLVYFLENEAPVIGNEKRRKRQGNDKPDNAEQAAPNGEAQQDDGWLQTRYMAHDFWRQEDVLNGLHDCKDG